MWIWPHRGSRGRMVFKVFVGDVETFWPVGMMCLEGD